MEQLNTRIDHICPMAIFVTGSIKGSNTMFLQETPGAVYDHLLVQTLYLLQRDIWNLMQNSGWVFRCLWEAFRAKQMWELCNRRVSSGPVRTKHGTHELAAFHQLWTFNCIAHLMDHLAHKCTRKGVWPVVATGTEHWASVCLWKLSCLLLLDSWVTLSRVFFLCKKGILKPLVKCFKM